MTYHGRGSLRKSKGRQRLRAEHLERMLAEEREVNHGLHLKTDFMLNCLRRVGLMLAKANSMMREQ